MNTPKDLEQKLWKAIESDRTMMLGLDGVEDGHCRPMTALVEDGHLAGVKMLFGVDPKKDYADKVGQVNLH